jgi:two-component system sensor histidine kinase/response regulator
MAQALRKSPLEQVGSAPVAGMQPNILLVDDRKENLLATEKVLRHLDAGIFKANSGNEALSLMLRHKFALVLLDVQMPEMDGFEVAMLMQQQESMRGTPIIFITAISKEEKYATQAAEIGAVDYIFKPINSDILRSKVKVYLDLYNQRQQILKLFDGLMQSNEELERFAYVCSHDMQEPVRMMNSYSELLAERCNGLLDDKGERYLHYITENAQRMQKMIADILTFSRVGREEVMIETVDSGEILREILAEFESIIAASNAKIIHENLPILKTSPTLLRILLQNLIGNALKFHNGKQAPQIRIEAVKQADVWEFSVEDNGIGIDPHFYDRVFTIFQRIHRREEYAGTGIGLSTCQKFIRLCGGDIRFESAPGAGTTFYFTLPIEGK